MQHARDSNAVDNLAKFELPVSAITSIMKLECWAYGDEICKTFFVVISPTRLVASLQKAIKYVEPVRFHDVDPDELDLYSIPCPGDEDFEKLTLKDMPCLEPGMEVSKLQGCLIIVNPPGRADPPVTVPVMTLNCYMHPVWDYLSIKVPRTATVGFLQRLIRKKVSVKNRLALYKVSIPYGDSFEGDPRSIILDEDKRLNVMTILSDAFSDGPIRRHVHIIAKEHSSLPEPLQRLPSLKTRRCNFLDKPAQEPLIDHCKRATRCNCPHFAIAEIPVMLLHPVFGQFLDDCETHEPTPDDNSLAMDLQMTMSEDYVCENHRAKVVHDMFMEWDLELVPRQGMDDEDFRLVITEFEDNILSLEADPYREASLCYLRWMEPHAPGLEHSALPCLIVFVTGPFITFAGAAWNTRPVIQSLSSLPLFYHDTDMRMRTRVARHLGAFKKAVHTLKEYYKCLKKELHLPWVVQLFPYRTHFQGNNGRLVDFEYEEQAVGNGLLFFGRFGDDRPICIKFVTRYSKDAHLVCASLGCAPMLHGFETLPGGWLMVVMDSLLPEEYMAFRDITPTTSLMENIRSTLEQLHQSGYVHGDFRDLNIMVSRQDETKFMLLDFDWAGRIGEVRYPANVNRAKDLWRPEGAVDGALIRAEHDMDMLDNIAKVCKVTD